MHGFLHPVLAQSFMARVTGEADALQADGMYQCNGKARRAMNSSEKLNRRENRCALDASREHETFFIELLRFGWIAARKLSVTKRGGCSISGIACSRAKQSRKRRESDDEATGEASERPC
jgi:hypothetical protein